MRHSDDWFKSEKDYTWIPGLIWFCALIFCGALIYICTF